MQCLIFCPLQGQVHPSPNRPPKVPILVQNPFLQVTVKMILLPLVPRDRFPTGRQIVLAYRVKQSGQAAGRENMSEILEMLLNRFLKNIGITLTERKKP